MIRRKKSDNYWLAATVVTVLTVGILTVIPVVTARSGALWITDDGNKWMVVENLIRHHSPEIVNPAAGLDPGNQFFPDAVFHFQRFRGAIRSIFPEFFPLLSVPFYLLGGWGGLLILPVLGAWLSLWLLNRLTRSWLKRPVFPWVPLTAFLATPLWFYAGTFWEMMPAVPFVIAFVLLAGKDRWVTAGAVLASGLWFRPEMYFVAAAAALVLLCQRDLRQLRQMVAGFGMAVLPFWIWQCVLYGHPLGLHGAGYYTHNAAGEGVTAFVVAHLKNYGYYYLAGPCPGAVALLYGAAVIAGWQRGRRAMPAKWGLLAVASLVMANNIVAMMQSETPVLDTIGTVGLLAGQPFLFVVALHWHSLWTTPNRPVRLAARIVTVYVLMLPFFLTSNDLGIIWGPRHFLFVLPVLLALAFYAAGRPGRGMKAGLLLLVFLSVLLQFHGIGLRETMKRQTRDLSQQVAAATAPAPVVVSDVYFLPMLTPARFFDRQWLYLNDDTRLPALLERFQQHDIREFSLILAADKSYRRLSNDAMDRLLQSYRVEIMKPVTAPDAEFLSLVVFQMRRK
ncbi:MAG: hypothetical protein IJC73_05415 [Lentisphaeria bacterium]|nr:hypothetical protein [Lentisphaeria bacterium]